MNVPSRVELETDAMILHWPGAAPQRLAHRTLRGACPCAGCRRLRIGAGETVQAQETAQEIAVVVTGMQPMGYGVQLIFSDGHDRGVFPWSYLEALPAIGSDTAVTA